VTTDRGAVEAAVARLDPRALADERWFGAKGREPVAVRVVEAFELRDGGPSLAVIEASFTGGPPERYLWPSSDDAWAALAVAIAEGRTIPSLPDPAATARAALEGRSPRPTAALVCRPSAGLADLLPEGAASVRSMADHPLGADQSNTSVVLGERLVIKAYRRVEIGLNPDLELTAFLSEEAGFPAVPRLAGYAELVTSDGVATVAMLQEYVGRAADAYEATAERVAAWLVLPGEVTVEFATEEAAELGRLTAALHATLADARTPGFEPRDARREELRDWREISARQLDDAIAAVPADVARELRAMAPAIAEQFTVFEALPALPIVTRVHADYHLGQVLETPDGYVIIDFEGEPIRSLERRRRHDSPLRDVASMLRSIDHAGRSGRRRAAARAGGRLERTGLDLDGWLRRSRERFLEAYRAGLREAGSPIVVDPELLRAFEFEKECYEFIYAATYLPDWLWAPTEGMRALIADAGSEG
jgi:trehalose synthase-fused probable maltokinase